MVNAFEKGLKEMFVFVTGLNLGIDIGKQHARNKIDHIVENRD